MTRARARAMHGARNACDARRNRPSPPPPPPPPPPRRVRAIDLASERVLPPPQRARADRARAKGNVDDARVRACVTHGTRDAREARRDRPLPPSPSPHLACAIERASERPLPLPRSLARSGARGVAMAMAVTVGPAALHARHVHCAHATRHARAHARVFTTRRPRHHPFPLPRTHARTRCGCGGARSLA
jgi:hypothetical protein